MSELVTIDYSHTVIRSARFAAHLPRNRPEEAVMKRALVTTVVAGGMLLNTASPAAAAAPEGFRTSGQFSYLDSYSLTCTPEVEGRQVCTEWRLSATDGPEGVFVSVEMFEQLSLNGEPVDNLSYAWSEKFGDLPFTVTKDLTATLAPTTLVVETVDDDGRHSREVTFSASSTAVGPVGTTRSRDRFTDGSCTFTNSVRGSSGQVEGTIMMDGVTHPGRGGAGTSDVRSSQRCR